MNRNISKLLGDEKGISMIMTFFIMIIALSVVLSISILLYSEVKVIRNIGNSIVSFYAADSGIDKVLYYDRQVLPSNGTPCNFDTDCPSSPYTSCRNGFCTIPPSLSSRGLCSIFSSCTNDGHPDDPIEHSIYCNAFSGDPDDPQDPLEGDYCGGVDNPYDCTDCTIKFSTTFGNRTYYVKASVDSTYYLEVESDGAFADTGRQIQITIGQ
jgi:hypothetical protein